MKTSSIKKSSLFLGIVFFLLFAGCGSANKPVQARKDKEVVILAVNDIHANIDMFPRFAALVDSLKEVYPDLLVFSAGDNRTGNPVNDMYDPTNYPVIDMMNKIGFDLTAVGNHEWDAGIEAMQRNISDADFPFLCANVMVPDSIKLDVVPFEIIESQGIKIAVVGLLQLGASGFPSAHRAIVSRLGFRKGRDVVPDYKYLRDENQLFILLTHEGFEEDLVLADAYPFIDAIIGGHSHTLVEHPETHNGVLITQSGSKLNYATLLSFKFQDGKLVDKKAVVLDVKGFKKENAEIRALADRYNDDETMKRVLAVATSSFNTKEEIGCMITDAIRESSGADFVFQNTGGIRVNRLDAGPITVKDVYSADPFNNMVVVYTMTGAQLEHFIKEAFKQNRRQACFVSGMCYKVVVDEKDYPQSVFIKPDSGKFSRKARYKVAMNDYMATGIRFNSLDDGTSLYKTTEEMTIEYLLAKKKVDYQNVTRVK